MGKKNKNNKNNYTDILADLICDSRVTSEMIELYTSSCESFIDMVIQSPIQILDDISFAKEEYENYCLSVKQMIDTQDLPDVSIDKLNDNAYTRYMKYMTGNK